MFCGKDESHGRMNKEHFVPKALWDGERPALTRTVDAHIECNDHFKADNEYFRDVLAINVGPDAHPEVSRLLQGKLARKRAIQPTWLSRTLQEHRIEESFTRSGLYVGPQAYFEVDAVKVDRVLLNVAKGVFHSVSKQPLDVSGRISIIHDDAKVPEEIDAYITGRIEKMCPWQGFGDDVFACRYQLATNPSAIRCLLQFYRTRLFYVEVQPSEESMSARESAG